MSAALGGELLARAAGPPAEWEILLRLAAVAEGRGAGADVQTLDDEMVVTNTMTRIVCLFG